MKNENFMLISLEEEKSKTIAKVIGSKTCKKIINYLTEAKEASQKDLSDALKIPLNTLEYNIKKLLESGFIQKTKNFFWSKKGKKIIMYELSKKSIVISHKKSNLQKLKSILPAFILTAAGTFALGVFSKIKSIQNFPKNNDILYATKELGEDYARSIPVNELISSSQAVQSSPVWIWFLLGSLIAITIISIVNWRKL